MLPQIKFSSAISKLKLLLCLPLLVLAGCFEILEEININANGSGSFIYTANMSRSKLSLDGIMQRDSSNGYRVPKRADIERDLLKAQTILSKQPGISKVSITRDWVNYIYVLRCNFASVEQLDLALENLTAEFTRTKKSIPEARNNFSFSGTSFSRYNRYDATKTAPRLSIADKNIMRSANYTCICRFAKPVAKCSNPAAQISKDGRSVMLKQNLLELAEGRKTLANTIQLK
jgi:hypothetical protein